MPFARALADPGEDRIAVMPFSHRVHQFHHQHRLADAGAAEHRRLAAAAERREQVDHLDPGGEQSGRYRLVRQWRGER